MDAKKLYGLPPRLRKLLGGLEAGESAFLDGVTAGTVAVGKAVVPTTGKVVDELDVTTFKINGSAVAAAGISTATTSSEAELNYLTGTTPGTAIASKALALGTNKNVDTLVIADGGLKLGSAAGTAVLATAAEINNGCDVSGRTQELTASGAVTAGKQSVEIKHNSQAAECTIATAVAHQGLFVVKNTSASGTAAHTCVITTGSWDGTNKTATLNAPNECLVVYFDSAGNGTILSNVGSVGLS
jgi:hypothetical protein